MRRFSAGGLLWAVCVVSGCRSFGGERPRYEPLPQSVRLTVDQVASALIVSLDSSLRAAGLGVAHSAPREGYLESEWFDAVTRVRSPQPFNDGNVIKLRFFADPEQGRTRLLAESVVRIAWDPSVPQRELERMAPEGHAGRVLLDSLLTSLVPPVRPPPLRP